VNAAFAAASQAQSSVNEAVEAAEEAVYKANISLNSSLIYQANSILDDALAIKATSDALVERVNNSRDALIQSYSYIDAIYDESLKIGAMAEQSRVEANVSASSESKNIYTVNITDPWSMEHTGNDTVTFIDEEGFPHLYFIEAEPDYGSSTKYPNGHTNYYPQGSLCTASLPNDDTLELLPDGSYVLAKKDKTQWEYSFYGQLQEIVDTNRNKVSFHYSDNHELIRITDDFSRAIEIEREDGRIVKITGPQGREFFYSYDAGGRLTSRTDADDVAVCYEYTGNLLSRIIKPDGSSIKHYYTDINGKKVIDHTVDEEGNVEYFRYYPDEQYTEYINASGIVERHYYNDLYLTTKIEYGDDSFIEMEYDENNNMVKYINEVGYVYRYEYDENRNLIEAIDPENNIERWTYNEFNKVRFYTDKMGNTASYSYDGRGNLIAVTYSDLTNVYYEYNLHGQVVKTFDQSGNITVYTYDGNGYVYSIRDPIFLIES